jgi:FkbM family methyltransferase
MPEFDLSCMSILKARGIELRCIVDGGAAWGHYTTEVQQLFPKATYLLIEPRQECRQTLEALSGNVIVETALIGDCEREVEFWVHDLQSSVFRNTRGEGYGAHSIQRMTTLDDVVTKHNICPDWLKLDLQGAELMALDGAKYILDTYAPIIQMETSLIEVQQGIPLIRESINYMAECGYALYDLTDGLRRTLDQALAQVDCIFIREDHELRRDRRWGWGGFS